MTTTTVDVNAAFAAERQQMIAQAYLDRDSAAERFAQRAAEFQAGVESGRYKDLGGGRYEAVGEGWDKGEVWIMQQPKAGEIPLLLPQSGLDMNEDGTAKLYTAVPTWHSLEGVGLIPGGTTDIREVLKLGGIDFTLIKVPAKYDWKGVEHVDDSHWHNVRSDTGATLAVVGSDYTPAQPREQLAFLQELSESYDVPFESAGPLRGGKVIFVSMKLPQSMIIDEGGLNDEVQLFLVCLNPNDGHGRLKVLATPWRPICGNTNRFAERDAVATWGTSHTKNWKTRAEDARQTLMGAEQFSDEFVAEGTKLAQTEMTLGEVEQVLRELRPFAEPKGTNGNAPSKSAITQHAQRLDKVFANFAVEAGRVGRTAYAVENAVSDYLDHDMRRRPGSGVNMAAAAATAIVEGENDDVKRAVHKRLLTLAS